MSRAAAALRSHRAAARPVVAFHAPMKPPDHPTPSGDREIARLTMAALDRAGFEVRLASRLRVLDLAGDAATETRLMAEAEAEAARIVAERAWGAALWFTYHSHYKAPDLLGPAVAGALGLPYALSEPSLSPRRRTGPWAGFAARAEAAAAAADLLFWTTPRDRPALEAAGHGARMMELPAFLDPGPPVPPRSARTPLRLLTVAMMRPGDKAESYRRLAAGLARLGGDWALDVIGDGPAREEVAAMLAPLGAVRLLGAADRSGVRGAMEAADLLLWPGVGEGVGMVWLEAQAAGLPVVAEDGPAARAAVKGGVLATPGDPEALAAAIAAAARDRTALSVAGRAGIEARHGIEAAARTLAATLHPLAERARA